LSRIIILATARTVSRNCSLDKTSIAEDAVLVGAGYETDISRHASSYSPTKAISGSVACGY
jgi:hypothetical protein